MTCIQDLHHVHLCSPIYELAARALIKKFGFNIFQVFASLLWGASLGHLGSFCWIVCFHIQRQCQEAPHKKHFSDPWTPSTVHASAYHFYAHPFFIAVFEQHQRLWLGLGRAFSALSFPLSSPNKADEDYITKHYIKIGLAVLKHCTEPTKMVTRHHVLIKLGKNRNAYCLLRMNQPMI